MRSKTYPCPCCGFLTFDEQPPGTYAICPVCYWEDDEVQYRDPDYAGGANSMSLAQARMNFREFGAVAEEFRGKVRPPALGEQPS